MHPARAATAPPATQGAAGIAQAIQTPPPPTGQRRTATTRGRPATRTGRVWSTRTHRTTTTTVFEAGARRRRGDRRQRGHPRRRPARWPASAPLVASPWTMGLNPDPFESAELGRLLVAARRREPAPRVPDPDLQGRRTALPRAVEDPRRRSTRSRRATGATSACPPPVRSAGCSLCRGRGGCTSIVADGRGRPNPFNPTDAIFTAARYLAASGARHNLGAARFRLQP